MKIFTIVSALTFVLLLGIAVSGRPDAPPPKTPLAVTELAVPPSPSRPSPRSAPVKVDPITDEHDYALLERTWATLTQEQRDNACIMWNIDQSDALELFLESYGKPLDKSTVVGFFYDKC